MATDIYLRSDDDPLFKSGVIDISDNLSILLMQIEMCIFTEKWEVFGEPRLGLGLESLLWETNLSEIEIKRKLETNIQRYCPYSRYYEVKVNVIFSEGEVYDYCVLDVVVDGKKAFSTVLQRN